MKDFEQKLAALAAAEGLPSLVVGLRRGGDFTFYGAGFADIERDHAPDEHTIYPIGSCSKAFIAAALCIACDDGLLTIDTPVRDIVKDFRMYTDELTRTLTVRDTLSHSACISGHNLVWEYSRPDMTMRDIVYMLRYMEPVAPARYRMYYLNNMFTLACVILEDAAKMPWYTFVKTRLLDPLGMTRTFFSPSEYESDLNRALPYSRGGDGKPAGIPPHDVFRSAGAAGCLSSTAHDMDIWLRLHLGRGELGGVRCFSQRSARMMHSTQTVIRPGEFYPFDFPDELRDQGYGLGWCVQNMYGKRLVAHGGVIRGFTSLAAFAPDDGFCYTVICNMNGGNMPNVLGYDIAAKLFGSDDDWVAKVSAAVAPRMEAAAKQEAARMEALDTNAAPPLPLERYAGDYTNDIYGIMRITRENGKLAAYLEDMRLDMIFLGDEFLTVEPRGIKYPLAFTQSGDAVAGFIWNPEVPVEFTRI